MNDKLWRRVLWSIAALVLLLNGVLYAIERTQPSDLVEELQDAVYFLDVGQGDSALLVSGGEAVLIDAGEAEQGSAVEIGRASCRERVSSPV